MFKKLAVSLAVALAALPLVSSAAVAIDTYGMTINGKQTDAVRAGSSYKLVFLVDVNSGDEVEYVEVTHIDENGDEAQAPQCFKVNPRLVNVSNGQVNLTVKTASDLPDGPYGDRVRTFGVSGLAQSNGCDFNNFGDEMTFEDRLFIDHTSAVSTSDPVVGGNTSTGTGAGSADMDVPAWLEALLAKWGISLSGPTTPAKPAVCTGLTALINAARPWAHASTNVALQQHLIANGYAHVISYGATGFYGQQTTTAVGQATMACSS